MNKIYTLNLLVVAIALFGGCDTDKNVANQVKESAAESEPSGKIAAASSHEADSPTSRNVDEALAENSTNGATETVARFLSLVIDGEHEAAVECWDCAGLAQRIYGEDCAELSLEEQATLADLHKEFLLRLLSNPIAVSTLKECDTTRLCATETKGVTTLTSPHVDGDDESDAKFVWVLHNADGTDKLVDLNSGDGLISASLTGGYASAGLGPIAFVESLISQTSD